jgi:hypothetical protein
MSKPANCTCDYNFTCRVCLDNAPPYFFTPTESTQRAKYLRLGETPTTQFQRIAEVEPDDGDTLD